jgi:hypothetical protein
VRPLCLCGALLLAALPLAAGARSAWQRIAPAEMSAAQRAQAEAAAAARESMFNRLMGRLKSVMEDQGPAEAIAVCRDEAPQIARETARERGVGIGRTSSRLRNPKNRPPEWARSLVKERAAEPTFLAHRDGRLAALLPIRLKQECLGCHGAPAELKDDVKSALRKLYPRDRATGFAEGDLRGWFWVEVPARK